jgi:hypothetical protein
MIHLSIGERADAYNSAFPKNFDSHLRASKRWLSGNWLLGNNYRGSGYHGSFPPGLLARIMAIYPDVTMGQGAILHLFSGSLEPNKDYVRFDRRAELQPDVCGDALHLSSYFEREAFEIIIADPPYTEEDAGKYGTCLISRNHVLKQCLDLLPAGGHVIWLDQVLPMYSKEDWEWFGFIGIVRSTNHRVRGLFFFEKV